VHDDGGIQAHDVIAMMDHRPPPGAFDVVFQLNAQGTIIEKTRIAAIDFARRKNEPASLAQRDEGFQRNNGRGGGR